MLPTNDALRAKALRSPHAPLVFADRLGELREFKVRTLPDQQLLAIHHCTEGTLGWDEEVVVTNDRAILDYLSAASKKLPCLPVAGDRPGYVLDPARVRVALVNAGGPAPGLNMVNDSITKRYHGLCEGVPGASTEVLGYEGGFRGLAHGQWKRLIPSATLRAKWGDPEKCFVTDDHALDPSTFLHSSRFDIRDPDNLNRVVEGLTRDRIDVLHVCGGDGSLAGARAISQRLGDRPVVVCAPKTMDNDLQLADSTFGFLTTVDHTVRAIRTFHTTVESQDRLGLMQVFGASSGFVALQASYDSGEVDYVIIPEEVERIGLKYLLGPRAYEECVEEARFHGLGKALEGTGTGVEDVYRVGLAVVLDHAWGEVRKRLVKRKHALVVIAEGAKGMFKHGGKGVELMSFAQMEQFFKGRLARDRDEGLRATAVTPLEPRYLIRDNPPQAFDVDLCKIIGKAMVDAALAGYTECAVTRWCDQYVLAPLGVMTHLTNRVDPHDYAYRTMIAKYQYGRLEKKEEEVTLSAEVERRYDELIGRAGNWPEDERARLERAWRLARMAHAGQQRKHGEPYLVHPLRVASRLLDEREVNADLVCAALLHDALEDSGDKVVAGEVAEACGGRVLEMVLSLTSPAETARRKAEKVRLAPRPVWLLKLADRLDNLTDALNLDPGGRDSLAFWLRYHEETRTYYLPLAADLGNERLRAELMSAFGRLCEAIRDARFAADRSSAANIELDLSRLFLPGDVPPYAREPDDCWQAKLLRARQNMTRAEAGEFINSDEHRQVGPYWLRDCAKAPREFRDAIADCQKQIEVFARQVVTGERRGERKPFTQFLLIGTGGSALGSQCLYNVCRVPGKTPPLFVFDNTDPEGFERVVAEVEAAGGLEGTLTLVVSRSGETKETHNGLEVARRAYQRAGLDFARHAVAVAPQDSWLEHQAATESWLAGFPIWDWVGGRTSLCSAAGLLPAALCGFDWRGLLDGARESDQATRPDADANPALRLAAAWYHLTERAGPGTMVVVPYSDRLSLLATYLQQLVVESPGKRGKGITVYGNNGSTDRHSYIQQLSDGRPDFFAALIGVGSPLAGELTTAPVEGEITCGDYLAAFQEGAARSLSAAGRLSYRLTLDRLDEFTFGALVALFERAVGYYAAMAGVNAYHQPGVEASEASARDYLLLQERLIAHLRGNRGLRFSSSELAREFGTGRCQVHDILRRLAKASRFSIVQEDGDEGDLGFTCSS